jgi:hypothetical protein
MLRSKLHTVSLSRNNYLYRPNPSFHKRYYAEIPKEVSKDEGKVIPIIPPKVEPKKTETITPTVKSPPPTGIKKEDPLLKLKPVVTETKKGSRTGLWLALFALGGNF